MSRLRHDRRELHRGNLPATDVLVPVLVRVPAYVPGTLTLSWITSLSPRTTYPLTSGIDYIEADTSGTIYLLCPPDAYGSAVKGEDGEYTLYHRIPGIYVVYQDQTGSHYLHDPKYDTSGATLGQTIGTDPKLVEIVRSSITGMTLEDALRYLWNRYSLMESGAYIRRTFSIDAFFPTTYPFSFTANATIPPHFTANASLDAKAFWRDRFNRVVADGVGQDPDGPLWVNNYYRPAWSEGLNEFDGTGWAYYGYSHGGLDVSVDGTQLVAESLASRIAVETLGSGNSMFMSVRTLTAIQPYASSVFTSPDGEHWTQVGSFNGGITNLVYGGGKWVGIERPSTGTAYGVWASGDNGVTWARHSVMASVADTLYDVFYGNGLWVGVGIAGSSRGRIFSSTDASSWTARVTSSGYYIVRYANNMWLAAGITANVATSSDGTSWSTTGTGPFNVSSPAGLEYGNGTWVAIGSGTCAVSTTGTSWTAVVTPPTGAGFGLGFGNGLFASIRSGEVRTSTDGVTWTDRYLHHQRYSSMSTPTLLGLAFVDGRWLCRTQDLRLALRSYVLSDDGINWSAEDRPFVSLIGQPLIEEGTVAFDVYMPQIQTTTGWRCPIAYIIGFEKIARQVYIAGDAGMSSTSNTAQIYFGDSDTLFLEIPHPGAWLSVKAIIAAEGSDTFIKIWERGTDEPAWDFNPANSPWPNQLVCQHPPVGSAEHAQLVIELIDDLSTVYSETATLADWNGITPMIDNIRVDKTDVNPALVYGRAPLFAWIKDDYVPLSPSGREYHKLFAANAITTGSISRSYKADAVLVYPTFTANAVLFKARSSSLTGNAVIAPIPSFAADAILLWTSGQDPLDPTEFTATAILDDAHHHLRAFIADAVTKITVSASALFDAALVATGSASATANAIIHRTNEASFSADSTFTSFTRHEVSITSDAILGATQTVNISANAIKLFIGSSSFTVDAIARVTVSGSISADAEIYGIDRSVTYDAGTSYNFGTYDGVGAYWYVDAMIRVISSVTFTVDAEIAASDPAKYDSLEHYSTSGTYD